MTREFFLERLRLLLFDLPEAERSEAIRYWNEYFDEAGAENEGKILGQLGTPEDLSKQIHEEIGIQNSSEISARYGNYSENRFHSADDNRADSETKTPNAASGNKYKTTNIVLWIVVAILSSPIWLPVGLGIIGVLIAIVIPIFVVALVLDICAVAFAIGGIVALFIYPLAGIELIACSAVLAGIGIFATMLNVWLWAWAVPMCCSKNFRKRRRERRANKEGNAL